MRSTKMELLAFSGRRSTPQQLPPNFEGTRVCLVHNIYCTLFLNSPLQRPPSQSSLDIKSIVSSVKLTADLHFSVPSYHKRLKIWIAFRIAWCVCVAQPNFECQWCLYIIFWRLVSSFIPPRFFLLTLVHCFVQPSLPWCQITHVFFAYSVAMVFHVLARS